MFELLRAPKNWVNIFKIKELRERILFTLALLAVYRVGTHIPLPGVNAKALGEFFREALAGTTFGIYDIFVGGALQRAAVFGIGIMPYISASIIIQLLTTAVPTLERLQKEGEHGRRKINQYTRYLTIFVAAVQAFGITAFLQRLTSPSGAPVVPHPGPLFTLSTVIALVAGTMFLMWMGEQITERGIGNGISVLIFVGSLDAIPNEIMSTITLYKSGAIGWQSLLAVALLVVLVTAAVVAVTEAQRRVPIHYAKRMIGRRVYGGQTTYLPLTVNTAGVIPIIFAQSVMMFPQTISTFSSAPWAEGLAAMFQPGTWLYDSIYAALIIFFAYFYTSVVINPKDMADNLQRYSGFIPGVRPGEETARYIDRVLTRIILPGAVFFAIIALIPWYISKWFNVPLYFGGTRLLIIVGVALEMLQQINAHLVMRQYDGLLRKGTIRGWRT